MDITYAQYIDRPSIVKGSATNSMITLVKQDYRRRFDAIFVRESSLLVTNLYKDKTKPIYYVYIKMPSEKTPNLYYDVIIEFRAKKFEKILGSGLDKYNVRFFSNDPAFLFTYAYAFNKANLIIDWLKPRLSKQALTQAPVIRNPNATTGYVKSLYFAYFYMDIKKLFNLDSLAWKSAKPLDKRQIIHQIPDFDVKLDDVRRLKQIQKEKAKQMREEQKLARNPLAGEHTKQASVSARTKNVNQVKVAQTVAKVRRVGTVKRK